jgi:hypothetical protein
MNSSTSSSSAPLFLAAMAGGLALAAAAFTLAPESWIHTAPEYGMAEAFEDHIEEACARKAAPELLIVGDSRAVAGLSVEAIEAAGIDAEKFALGGSGIFAGWATLDRLIDCGVRPKAVVMAYGTVHMLDTGAVMDRSLNYDVIKGPRAEHAYGMLSNWEDRGGRKIAFKAVSAFGAEATLLDFVLMRPALRNVLERPPLAFENHRINERERLAFERTGGDRFYGEATGTDELPDEASFEGGLRAMNLRATEEIAKLGREHGFDVLFYVLPVSELAREKLPPRIFELAEEFRGQIRDLGVLALNDVWSLPDADFGDPSHVNAAGRAKVVADFLKRVEPDRFGWKQSGANQRGRQPFATEPGEPPPT